MRARSAWRLGPRASRFVRGPFAPLMAGINGV